MSTVDITNLSSALDCPYVGLGFYTQENAAMFFGRDTEQTVLISNLRASRLTLLYAKSGTGKSSLLRAGVAATLADLAQRSFDQRGTARNVPVVFGSWRDDPIADLIGEILRAISPFLSAAAPPVLAPDRLETAIEAANRATGAALLVILDQFEDHLLHQSGEAQDWHFADELAACINRADLRVNFLIAIREDAYFALGDVFKGRISNVYGNYFRLENLSREAAREAIEKPIAAFNELHSDQVPVHIEPGLVAAVLSQFGADEPALDQSGASRLAAGAGAASRRYEVNAAYLQLVIKRLWDVELGEGSRKLRLRTFNRLGGAETIVRTHVERALGGLTEEEREAAAALFHYLVTPSGTKTALTASDLAAYSERPTKEIDALLQRLASSEIRILRQVPPPPGRTTGTRFEIFHDLLVGPIQRWSSHHKAVRLEQTKNAERQARDAETRTLRFRTTATVAVLVAALAILITTLLVAELNGRTSPVTVGTTISALTTTVQFPAVSDVQAGSSITGHVSFTNSTDSARQVRLMLVTSGATATLINPTGVVTVPAASTPSVPFTISFAKDSPVGSARLQIKVVDAAAPLLVYNQANLTVTVTNVPSFIARYLWVIIGILIVIVLIILLALWRRAVVRRQVDVRDLVVILRRNGEQMGSELTAPSRWSDSLTFIIRDEFEPTARLDYPVPGFPRYIVRRSDSKLVRLLMPTDGDWYPFVVGGPGERIGRNGLELAFRDKRQPRAEEPSRPVITPSSSGVPAAGQLVPIRPSPPTDDEWL